MRSLLFLYMISILVGACSMQAVQSDSQALEPQRQASGTRQPVLVELFTSEGCSSCPPADRNLAFLSKHQPVTNAEIITLAFHVDYWDRLGWKDRFSSSLFSQRQESYSQAFKLNSNYTPQMVVDGTKEFVGSDSGKAASAITDASGAPKATVDVRLADGKWKATISNVPAHNDATIFLAIAEDGLSTRVGGGENSGATLEHVSVVRELKTLGMIATESAGFESDFEVKVDPDWKKENLKVVVFVQENDARKVIGVGSAKFQ